MGVSRELKMYPYRVTTILRAIKNTKQIMGLKYFYVAPISKWHPKIMCLDLNLKMSLDMGTFIVLDLNSSTLIKRRGGGTPYFV